jgi:hypothetical protein
MIVSTTRCKDHGHAEFVLEVDERAVPPRHVSRVIETIEGLVAQGSVFTPGETLQIGWMVTRVQRYDEGRLTLLEPDMRTFPMAFVPGVTGTLRQMMLQLLFIDSLAVSRGDMDIPSVCQSAVACKKYRDAKSLVLSRGKPHGPRDSGWFIGCLDGGHDHEDENSLALVSLYEAFINQNQIQGWMAFPATTLIALQDGDTPKVFRDGKDLRIVTDSFLARLLERNAR